MFYSRRIDRWRGSIAAAGMLGFLVVAVFLPVEAAEPETPELQADGAPVPATSTSPKKFFVRFRSDFYSRYLWNGIPFSKGAVWQPSGNLEFYGAGLSLWGNFVLNDEPNQGHFNELDFSVYYRRSVGKWNLQGSFIALFYFNDDPASLDRGPNALQLYFQVDRRLGPVKIFSDLNLGLFQPAGSIFWDLGVSYRKELPRRFAMETSFLFGLGDARFNRAYLADAGTQANLVAFSLAFPWTPIRGVSFIPSMTVSNLVAPALRRASPDPTVVWGGLSVVYER